jgi:GNAT superfamily N-acetyltransferase
VLIPDVFCRNWRRLIEDGRGFVLVQFDEQDRFCGTLGAVLAPDLCNDDLVAIECFWYVMPHRRGNGLTLLRAYEQLAREKGAQRIGIANLAHHNGERMARLYQRLGYTPIDVNYQKAL